MIDDDIVYKCNVLTESVEVFASILYNIPTVILLVLVAVDV